MNAETLTRAIPLGTTQVEYVTNLKVIGFASYTIPIVCPKCNLQGYVRGTTVATQADNVLQTSLLPMKKIVSVETINSNPSWNGNHDGCNWVWKPKYITEPQNSGVFLGRK